MTHIPTILIILALSHLACAAVLGLVSWKIPKYRGIREWAIGRGFLVAAYLFLLARGDMPLTLSVVMANGLLFLGMYIIWLGNARFMRRDIPKAFRTFIIISAGLLLFLAFLSMREGTYGLRVMLFSAFVVFYAIASIYVFWQRNQTERTFSLQMVILSYILLIAVHLSRFTLNLLGAGETGPLLADSPAGYVLIADLFVAILTTTAVLALVAESLHIELKHTAERDPLTGAYNRRPFFTIVNNLFARARRNGEPISVLSIDLDYFKKVNDSGGRLIGDKILKQFVEITSRHLRPHDLYARFGGDEFVVVLPETNSGDAREIADRIRSAFFKGCDLGGAVVGGNVSCSVGIASVNELTDDTSIDELLERSDKALYHSKVSGRNRVSAA